MAQISDNLVAPLNKTMALLVAPPRESLGAATMLRRLEHGTSNNQSSNALSMYHNERALQRDAANGQNIMHSEKQTAAKEAKRNLGNCTEKVRQYQAEMDAMEQARGESRAILERDRTSETKMSSGDRG